MTAEEAGKILGLKPGDTEITLRRKYRRLMRIHHPDSGAADEGSYARLVTQAYDLLRDTLESAGEAEVGRSAGREAERKHYWDPDREDFLFFLKSVNAAVSDRLSEIEWEMGIYSAEEHPDPGFRAKTQMKAFHLLIQEYIRPLSCLRKLDEIAEPVHTEKGKTGSGPETSGTAENKSGAGTYGSGSIPEIYRISGRIGAKDGRLPIAAAALLAGDPAEVRFGLRGSRLVAYLAESGAELGEVSFEDDPLYYLVLPLIARGAARAECEGIRIAGSGRHAPAGVNAGRGPLSSAFGRKAAATKRSPSVQLDILITVTDPEEADRPGNGGERLEKLFAGYRKSIEKYGAETW